MEKSFDAIDKALDIKAEIVETVKEKPPVETPDDPQKEAHQEARGREEWPMK